MNYIIIMPAFNEAKRIHHTLSSLAHQTLLPQKLIVVNDGSTDATPDIVEKFSADHPWVRLVNKKVKAKHSPGGKIVRAFYTGFNTIEEDFDFIVKLDADLQLPNNYFEVVARIFKENPQVGIAGGVYMVEEDGQWVYEQYTDMDHVKGASKSYRKACFEDIGGLKESVGWDSVDELLARYHGWEIWAEKSLQVRHLRFRGQETGFVKVMVKIGHSMYRMRYGFLVGLLSAGKQGIVNKPYLITGLATFYGFLQAWLRGDQYIVDKEEGKFIRNYRLARMKKKYLG